MFPPPELPPVPVERGAEVRRKSFCQEQLAFAKGTERNRAGGVCAFMEHGLGPVFSSVEFRPDRDSADCTRRAEDLAGTLEVIGL